MSAQLQKLKELKNWLNSERLTASAYNYERNMIVQAIQLVEEKINEIELQKIVLSEDEPEDMKEGDFWFDS